MDIIKKRKLKKSSRGLYLQDIELKETNFNIGEGFKYIIDNKNKKVIILPSTNNNKNTVSKRKIKNSYKPVIDIRSKKALEVFREASCMQVTILKNKIVIEELKEVNYQNNVIEIKCAKVGEAIEINKSNIRKVAGFSEYSIFNSIINKVKKDHRNIEIPLQIVSLFSGCGLLDKGFIDQGFSIAYAIEKDKNACETYKYNIGHHVHCEDITNIDVSKLPKAPIIIGGIPCVSFSNANRINNLCFLDNPKNILVDKYIETVNANENCKVFVIENVPQLLTCGKGKFLEEIKNKLKDFKITTKIVNAVKYGGAQLRERAIIIGSKIGEINLPDKIVNTYKTVRDAFCGLTDNTPNQKDYSKPKKETIERMSYVLQGGNIYDIPEEIRPKGTHSNIYKRLELDKPSITIVNPRKSVILHPILNRILSVRECARIQGMPDDFIFKGPLSAKQQGVANGVPYEISSVVAKYVKQAFISFNNTSNCY